MNDNLCILSTAVRSQCLRESGVGYFFSLTSDYSEFDGFQYIEATYRVQPAYKCVLLHVKYLRTHTAHHQQFLRSGDLFWRVIVSDE